jgi:hypothetical protein
MTRRQLAPFITVSLMGIAHFSMSTAHLKNASLCKEPHRNKGTKTNSWDSVVVSMSQCSSPLPMQTVHSPIVTLVLFYIVISLSFNWVIKSCIRRDLRTIHTASGDGGWQHADFNWRVPTARGTAPEMAAVFSCWKRRDAAEEPIGKHKRLRNLAVLWFIAAGFDAI